MNTQHDQTIEIPGMSEEQSEAFFQNVLSSTRKIFAREKERAFFHSMLDLEIDICAIEDEELRDRLKAYFYQARSEANLAFCAYSIDAREGDQ